MGEGEDYIKKCKWCQNDIKMHFDKKNGWKAYDVGGKIHNCRKKSSVGVEKSQASFTSSKVGIERVATIDSIVDDMERVKKILDSIASRIREL